MAHPLGEPLNAGELATFVAAIDGGTISAAAEALELTQSAASKRLASLEQRLGVRLLERSRLGVVATAAGRVLYPEAQRALIALRDAAAVVATQSSEEPTLHIAASHTIGGFLIPGWLWALRRDGRHTHAQVEIVNSMAVLMSVRRGDVDIGFIESFDDTGELETITVLHDEIVAVVAADHPWARRRSIPARLLLREPYLSREPGSGTRAVAGSRLAEAGVTLDPAVETASTQSLKRAVLDGGFTLISRLTIENECRTGTLCAIPVQGLDLTRPLRAVRRRRPAPSREAARFWAQLQTAPWPEVMSR